MTGLIKINMKYFALGFIALLVWASFSTNLDNKGSNKGEGEAEQIIYPEEERFFTNIKQLTFGGENAEAYFSFDNRKIVFQRTNKSEGIECDQIYFADITGDTEFSPSLVSTGEGRTTCPYFLHGDSTIIYASTHMGDAKCPEVPDRSVIKKYVWPIYSDYEIYVSNLDGKLLYQLSDNDVYDAEATVSPEGDKIVFTSMRNGDLDLYTMDTDGSNVKQITFGLGYDGGAFFSPDGLKLIFRSSRPKTDEEIQEYKDLLAQGLVAPTRLELYICNIDGSELKQVTHLGGANWAPFFHPSGEMVIFSSNYESERGFPFNLYMINIDGTALQQITHDGVFDAFPMFSHDGKKIIFSSNRNNGDTRDTNLFIADWKQ